MQLVFVCRDRIWMHRISGFHSTAVNARLVNTSVICSFVLTHLMAVAGSRMILGNTYLNEHGESQHDVNPDYDFLNHHANHRPYVVQTHTTARDRAVVQCSYQQYKEIHNTCLRTGRRRVMGGVEEIDVTSKPARTLRLPQCVTCMRVEKSLGYGSTDESRTLIHRIHRLWTVYELATPCPGRDTSTGHRVKSCGEPMLPTYVVERVYELEYTIHVCTKPCP